MKILVCIKQVPGTTMVEVDEETGVLKRDGVESKMNRLICLRLNKHYHFGRCMEETLM